jgi:hypothetical protein
MSQADFSKLMKVLQFLLFSLEYQEPQVFFHLTPQSSPNDAFAD